MVSSLLPTVCLQSAEGISSEHLGFWTVACRLLLQILFIMRVLIFPSPQKCVSFLQGAAAVQQDRFGYLARSLGTSHILFPAEIWSLRR